jgi:hypothetical protein
MEVNAVCSRFSSRVGLGLVSLFLFLGALPQAIAQAPPLTATLETNRGCGSSAVFNLGESISFRYSVSQNAYVTLRLRKPGGAVSTLVFNRPTPAGVIQIVPGVIGLPTGDRLLILDAVTATQAAHMECVYTAQSGQNPNPLTVTLETNKGCGASTVFAFGEAISFRYRVSKDAFVTLRRRLPDGSVRTLLFNQPVPGGVTQTIPGVIGAPAGDRLLTLDAVTSTESAHAECVYTGSQGGGGNPLTLTLQLNRGCGAIIRVGEPFAVNYGASADAFLTMIQRRDDGTTRVIFVNRFVRGGQIYSIAGLAAMPTGGRTLLLQTASGMPSVQTTCTYTVIP